MKTLLAAFLLLPTIALLADSTEVTLYSAESSALWNRVRASLLSRVSPGDALDLGFNASTADYYKLAYPGASNARALASLSEFEKAPLPPNMRALHRAVMQRDLLTVFHWAVDRQKVSDSKPELQELIRLLAKGIRKVALTEAEIRQLPDNYTLATAKGDQSHAFDPSSPKAFLPKDLLADDGEWIALRDAQEDRSITPQHDQVFMSSAVFEVRMRHPQGRKAGLDYLAQLPGRPQIRPEGVAQVDTGTLTLTRIAGKTAKMPPPVPEGEFPPGTAWALIRRSVLATPEGKPIISPLVDTVQIRVYRDVTKSGSEGQFAFEWEAKPTLTLSGHGFHLVQGEDQWLQEFPARNVGPHIKTMICLACHGSAGRESVLSRTIQLPAMTSGTPILKAPVFSSVTQAQSQAHALRLLRDRPGWVLLPWLCEGP